MGFINATVFPFVPVITAVAPELLPVIVSPIRKERFAFNAVSRSDSNCNLSPSSYERNSTPSAIAIESSGKSLYSLKVIESKTI